MDTDVENERKFVKKLDTSSKDANNLAVVLKGVTKVGITIVLRNIMIVCVCYYTQTHIHSIQYYSLVCFMHAYECPLF